MPDGTKKGKNKIEQGKRESQKHVGNTPVINVTNFINILITLINASNYIVLCLIV